MGPSSSIPLGSGFTRTHSFAIRSASDRPSQGFSPPAVLNVIRQNYPAPIPALISQEFDSISQEPNPEMFFQSLIGLGRRLSAQGHSDLASVVFSTITESLAHDFPARPAQHAMLSRTAQREMDAILGRGDAGMRVEFLARGLAREASNPVALASMGFAGLVFNTVRMGALSRILASASTGLCSRGVGARALAATVGFAAEVPAFVFSGRGLNAALGVQQDWSAQAIGHELAGAALVLSALKLSGAGSQGILRRMQNPHVVHPSALQSFAHRALPQFAMLGGIMAGHKAEEFFGLRPHFDNATTLVDSLSTLIVFNAAGRMLEGAMGPRYARFQRELHLRSEIMTQESTAASTRVDRPPLAEVLENLFHGRRLATSGVDPRTGRLAHIPQHWVMSENNGGEGSGEKPPSSPPSAPAPESTVVRPAEPISAKEAEVMGSAKTVVRAPESTPDPQNELVDAQTLMGPIPQARVPQEVESSGTQFFEPGVQAPLLNNPSLNPPGQTVWEPKSRLAGRYVLVRMIGEGGQGEVWEAFDSRVKRTVAIKRLRPMLQLGLGQKVNQGVIDKAVQVMRQRAERETTIAANLERFVVPLHDVLEIEPNYFVQVMKYVPGWDLSDILEGINRGDPDMMQRFPTERRLELFAKICEAVQHMHERGVSHRDLKPSNIRVSLDGDALLMDFGLAKQQGESEATVSQRMSIPAQAVAQQNFTEEGVFQGTPAYMAPETIRNWTMENFRSPDIFALGIILYEWMTASHPFSKFRGSPEDEHRTPERNEQQQPVVNRFGAALWSDAETREKVRPPTFRQLATSAEPDFFYLLEDVARRAMEPVAADRFENVLQLGQAVQLTQAVAEYGRIQKFREEMGPIEQSMHQAWEGFTPGTHITPERVQAMRRPIIDLIHRRAAWHQKFENLHGRILEISRGQPWAEAKHLIAQLSWERLIDGGDRMDQSTRQMLMDRITENDVPTESQPVTSMRLALDGKLPISMAPHEIHSEKPVNGGMRLRIIPFLRERDENGKNLENFYEGTPIYESSLVGENQPLALPAGYYVFDFSYPEHVTSREYASMRVPLQIKLSDVRNNILSREPMNLDFEFVPAAWVSEDMVIIHKGPAVIGYDFYHDGPVPTATYSRPQRVIHFPTFAISRHPILVQEYLEFIQDELQKGNRDARLFIPRAKIQPREENVASNEGQAETQAKTGAQGILREFMALRREFGTTEAINRIKARFTGTVYFWNVKAVGRGKDKRLTVENPYTDLAELERYRNDPSPNKKLRTHVDPQEDPILPNQPIANIDFFGAEAFKKWRSEREGKNYRIQGGDEKEKVDRNGFPLLAPWGNEVDNPTFVNSRDIYQNGDERYIRPVGEHGLGKDQYGDKTRYGTTDNLGNVKEFTITPDIAPFMVTTSGGSVYVPNGPFFFPCSRGLRPNGDVEPATGGIRLVQDF